MQRPLGCIGPTGCPALISPPCLVILSRCHYRTVRGIIYLRQLVPPPNPRYTEQWRAMVETGVFCGPAKVSFISAWTPGPDRRNSTLIGKQSAAFVWHPTFDLFLGNYDVFRPYSWLFTYNYGSGFNAYNLSLDGYLRDAWFLGSRVDYAVAANLNVYGTFAWMERTSNGYGWGAISPSGAIFPSADLIFNINGASGSPNIPDRSLGWEVNAGFDWQLLEGFTVGFLAAYWQPGKWFNYACIDRSVPGWNVPTAANNFGTRPDKSDRFHFRQPGSNDPFILRNWHLVPHIFIRELNPMKNVLIMFGVLSVALMGTWGMCAIHGQTAAQPLGALGFQQGLYAPMELTWLDGLFQSLYGATPFILTADKEEEPKPETKEDEPTPAPDRIWSAVNLA